MDDFRYRPRSADEHRALPTAQRQTAVHYSLHRRHYHCVSAARNQTIKPTPPFGAHKHTLPSGILPPSNPASTAASLPGKPAAHIMPEWVGDTLGLLFAAAAASWYACVGDIVWVAWFIDGLRSGIGDVWEEGSGRGTGADGSVFDVRAQA